MILSILSNDMSILPENLSRVGVYGLRQDEGSCPTTQMLILNVLNAKLLEQKGKKHVLE